MLLLLSCKMGGDVIATTTAGDITRTEFEEWLQSRKIAVERVYDDSYSMSDYLKQIAVEKLTAKKGEDAGYSNDKKYLIIEKTLYKNLLSTFYQERRSAELTFSEEAADISIIRVFYKADGSNTGKVEKRKVVLSILERLKSGTDFNILASRYSEDAASKKNGRIGIVPFSLMENGLSSAVSVLKESQYTLNPVELGNSFALVKLHKRYSINEKNLKDAVTDKNNRDRILHYQREKFIDTVVNELRSGKDIVSYIDRSQFTDEKGVLFSINGESFTSGELDVILNLFYTLKNGVAPADGFPLKEKRLTSGKIFNERLMALDAERIAIDKNPEFIRNWFYLKRATLSGAYKYSVLTTGISVGENEIRQEYNSNLEGRYSKKITKNGREVVIPLQFAGVRDQIKKNISRDKLKSLKKKWDSEILKEGAFNIKDRLFSVQ